MSRDPPKTSGWTLSLAFAAIAGVFAVAIALALHQKHVVEAKNRQIVESMLDSVELVTRLARDVDMKRLLVDNHIFQKAESEMAWVEARIAHVDADFASAVGAYKPYTNHGAERVLWEDLRAQVDAIGPPIAHALALSRQNHDVEAGTLLASLEGRFDAIAARATALVRIDRAEAHDALVTMDALQRSSSLFAVALGLLGIVLSALVAVRVARLVAQREEQLRGWSELLEQRNRDLDAFAGRVAHDLRGPLTAVSLAASTLPEPSPREKTARASLQRGVSRMEGLITDLLALSRVGAEAPRGSADPAVVAASIDDEIRERLASEGGTLRMDVQPARVRCNEGLLRQVLWNLVDNAFKYRRPDAPPEVAVSGHPRGNQYELRVSDRGVGIPGDEAAQVFEPFFRARKPTPVPGTGLGLSIVKRIVEVSGGSITLDSKVGEGSTFNVLLPLESRGAPE
jgi:signal transduction histidine kinase